MTKKSEETEKKEPIAIVNEETKTEVVVEIVPEPEPEPEPQPEPEKPDPLKFNINLDFDKIEERLKNMDTGEASFELPNEPIDEPTQEPQAKKKRGRKPGVKNAITNSTGFEVDGVFLLFAIDLIFPTFFKFADKFIFKKEKEISFYQADSEELNKLKGMADVISAKYAKFLTIEVVFAISLFLTYGRKLGK